MYARQRYGGGARSFSRARLMEPACCEDCKCGPYCTGCPDSSLTASSRALPQKYHSFTSGLFGDETPESLRDKLTSEPVSTVSAVALTYHGYKRTGSLLWAVIYGFAGKTIPLVAVPVALAQGFGKQKVGC